MRAETAGHAGQGPRVGRPAPFGVVASLLATGIVGWAAASGAFVACAGALAAGHLDWTAGT